MLGPLLLSNMFFLLEDMHEACYTDDTLSYICGENMESVMKSLVQSATYI